MVESIVNGMFIPRGLEREDLVQTGLMGIWKAKLQFNRQYKTKFSTFAYTCARNEILMLVRKWSKFEREDGPPLDEELVEDEQDFTEKVELNDMMDTLSRDEAELVELLLHGYNQKEIATMYDLSQPFISKMVHQLRNRAKQMWGDL